MIQLLGLCPSCSEKLNHHTIKREIKRLKRNKTKKSVSRQRSSTEVIPDVPSTSEPVEPTTPEDDSEDESPRRQPAKPIDDETLWKKTDETELKGRDEEFDDYLADLLL